MEGEVEVVVRGRRRGYIHSMRSRRVVVVVVTWWWWWWWWWGQVVVVVVEWPSHPEFRRAVLHRAC